jgi:hypothetical protein
MNHRTRIAKVFGLLAVLVILAGVAFAERTPLNVAGTWAFQVTGDVGSADQTIVIAQDGDKLTGTFKGPRQSGTLSGTMDGNIIKLSVSAAGTIHYTGTVEGETMHGTLAAHGKTGAFTAHRTKAA